MTCKHPGCGEPEDYHLHRPSSECEGCLAPRYHHVFEPSEDPKDVIIRSLTAEVAELANLLEEAAADIEDRTAGESEAFSLRLRSDAARALLARLEARP